MASAPVDVEPPVWACAACTFHNHAELRACEVCEAPRDDAPTAPAPRAAAAAAASSDVAAAAASADAATGWGCLRPMTEADVKRRARAPPPPLEYLVVLDFEWTADRGRPMLPVAEITQFPSVLVRLDGRASAAVDEFNSYVRPTLNPVLTAFSIELTAISQATVDAAPPLAAVLAAYLAWLRAHDLVDAAGARTARRWAVCTWSDADVGGQLARECRHKGLAVPPCFDRWVDLKQVFRRHFHREPRGGLQRCVESVGLAFDGRAHDGLVDSRNTAALALRMARGTYEHGAFVFRRPTRGLDANGDMFGSRAAREKKRAREEEEEDAPSASSTRRPAGALTS